MNIQNPKLLILFVATLIVNACINPIYYIAFRKRDIVEQLGTSLLLYILNFTIIALTEAIVGEILKLNNENVTVHAALLSATSSLIYFILVIVNDNFNRIFKPRNVYFFFMIMYISFVMTPFIIASCLHENIDIVHTSYIVIGLLIVAAIMSMLEKPIIRLKIKKLLKLCYACSNDINWFFQNYAYANRIETLIGITDSPSQGVIKKSIEKSKEQVYRTLCKTWGKHSLKKVFRTRFIDHHTQLFIDLISCIDNSSATKTLAASYAVLQKKANKTVLPHILLCSKSDSTNIVTDLKDFKQALASAIQRKNQDMQLLDDIEYANDIAEQYLYLKRKALLVHSLAVIICILCILYHLGILNNLILVFK